MFRTGWFIESVISASLIVLVIRTRRPFLASKPHRLLAAATAAVVAITLILPYTPLAKLLGFHPVPPLILLVMASLVALYVLSAELLKRRFYRGSAA